VVAVGGLGIEHRLRVVGKYSVVAVDGEQLVLFTACGLLIQRVDQLDQVTISGEMS
jgi:hypothetical protein